MVTCKAINDWVNWGRLGNQMWSLAHVVGYAKKHDLQWFIPKWKYSQYFVGPFNEIDIVVDGLVDHAENGFHYNETPLIQNVNFLGYWQTPRYWNHCEHDIRDIFTFKPEVIAGVKTYIDHWRKGKIPVFIHKRRGDYVEGMAHYYHDLSLGWYAQAMNHFDPATHHFFLCSDDVRWCQQNFNSPHITFSVFDEIHDLCLMSQCTHGIMCNSSFSFWGQFLITNPNKIIIAPTKDKWFKPVANHNVDDLYMKNWELI